MYRMEGVCTLEGAGVVVGIAVLGWMSTERNVPVVDPTVIFVSKVIGRVWDTISYLKWLQTGSIARVPPP